MGLATWFWCEALFRPFNSDAEVVALALERVHVAVEFGGIVPVGRTVERQRTRKRRGLLERAV
jgi:hypothetical protein